MKAPILNYHAVGPASTSAIGRWTVTPELFESHLDLLESKGLRGVSVREALANPSPDQVALTFDDGFEDFVSAAAPALLKRGFSASFYVVTGDIGTSARWPGGAEQPMASWDDLRELDRLGFEIGAHSHSHPQLDLLAPDIATVEIERSRDLLHAELGHRIEGFCYPHGFYSRKVRQAVIDAGYEYACAVRHKMSGDEDDRYALARIVVLDDTTPDQIDRWLAGEDLRRGGSALERPLAAAFRGYRRVLGRTA